MILGSNPDCIPPVPSRDEWVRSSTQQQQPHREVVLQFGIHEGGSIHVVQHVDIDPPLVSNDDADQTDISQVNCRTEGRRPHQFGDVAQVTERLGSGIGDDTRHLILYKYKQNPVQAITWICNMNSRVASLKNGRSEQRIKNKIVTRQN